MAINRFEKRFRHRNDSQLDLPVLRYLSAVEECYEMRDRIASNDLQLDEQSKAALSGVLENENTLILPMNKEFDAGNKSLIDNIVCTYHESNGLSWMLAPNIEEGELNEVIAYLDLLSSVKINEQLYDQHKMEVEQGIVMAVEASVGGLLVPINCLVTDDGILSGPLSINPYASTIIPQTGIIMSCYDNSIINFIYPDGTQSVMMDMNMLLDFTSEFESLIRGDMVCYSSDLVEDVFEQYQKLYGGVPQVFH